MVSKTLCALRPGPPMNFSFAAPTPLEYFSSLVQNDDQFPLLEAAASLAQDEYPKLDVQQVLAEVDELTERLHRRIPADASALHRLRLLNQFYFGELKFGGNAGHNGAEYSSCIAAGFTHEFLFCCTDPAGVFLLAGAKR